MIEFSPPELTRQMERAASHGVVLRLFPYHGEYRLVCIHLHSALKLGQSIPVASNTRISLAVKRVLDHRVGLICAICEGDQLRRTSIGYSLP